MDVIQLIAFGRHDAGQAAGKRMGAAEDLFDRCGLDNLGLCVHVSTQDTREEWYEY